MTESPEKFVPVDVRPGPCTSAERDDHLRAFIDTFVERRRRERARHILLEAPHKAKRDLYKLIDHWLRDDLVSELTGPSPFPSALERRFGTLRGVYIDARLGCSRLTAPEAATTAALESVDAIFCFDRGRKALLFHHHGWVFLCESNPA